MCQYSPVYNYEQLIIVGSQIIHIVGHEVALEGGSKIAKSEIRDHSDVIKKNAECASKCAAR